MGTGTPFQPPRPLEKRAEDTAEDFKPQEVADLVWAWATMGHRPGADVMSALEKRAADTAEDFKPQGVVNLVWAWATMRHTPRPAAMSALEERAASTAGEFDPQAVANLVWAVERLGLLRIDRGLSSLKRSLSDWIARDGMVARLNSARDKKRWLSVSMTMVACATARWYPGDAAAVALVEALGTLLSRGMVVGMEVRHVETQVERFCETFSEQLARAPTLDWRGVVRGLLDAVGSAGGSQAGGRGGGRGSGGDRGASRGDRECRFGADCTRPDCWFSHPDDRRR